jgi:GNAT superfamily N-acetyltransferase
VGGARLPLIVRDIPGSDASLDAISPYGYPGATQAGAAEPPDPAEVDWSEAGLVSLFLRDRIGAPPAFAAGTERSRVQVHDPSRRRGVRSRFAEQIRRNQRQGWEVDCETGPSSSERRRATFLSLYTETMTRAGAAPRYFYDAAYFETILAFPRTWLLQARSDQLGIGAGGIAALSDGLLHYYLGGTADRALDASPFKNVVVAMMGLADELEAPLNLGGGIRPGDGLEDFKRGFANAELPFTTHEIVSDPEAYGRLCTGREATDFFPAYRA